MSFLSPSPHTFLPLWSISPVSSFFKEGLSGGYISSKDFFLSLPSGQTLHSYAYLLSGTALKLSYVIVISKKKVFLLVFYFN